MGKTFEEWSSEQQAKIEEFHRPTQYERGRYLDEMTLIDLVLGTLIARHFGVQSERVGEFVDWMFRRVSFAEKAAIVGGIVDSRGLQDAYGTLSKDLKDANMLRNMLAHAWMEPTTVPSLFITTRRGQTTTHQYTTEELSAEVDRAKELFGRVLRLSGEIAEVEGLVKNAAVPDGRPDSSP